MRPNFSWSDLTKFDLKEEFKKNANELLEDLRIIQSIPALNNIDLSGFELCKGSDELNKLITICRKVNPKILDLGNKDSKN